MQIHKHARILWWGNVRELSFKERVRFARSYGFDALNISPYDIDALLADGETLLSIKQMAQDMNVKLTYLDPVVSWLPDWKPDEDAKEMLSFLGAGFGREFEFAEALGIDRMLTITCFPEERYSIAELTDHLGKFAEEAKGYGILCVLEAMPMWGLKTFSQVVELWENVAASNVKLLFDTWHYCRGGRSDDLLESLPAGAIDHVQIADGSAITPPDMTLFEDCLYNRMPIGEGDLLLEELLTILNRNGHLRSVGPEVFSRELDALAAPDLAARLLPGFEAILQKTQTAL